ncbi:PHP domain-containing protein [Thermodesulfobacteriota bacterium]
MAKKIDLHIHSICSDGRMTPLEIFEEANRRGMGLISITDHDSIECQEEAIALSDEYDIFYIQGLELSISFSHPGYRDSKPISLDFLAYGYKISYQPLVRKLTELRDHRTKRAKQILEKINLELLKKGIPSFTHKDMIAIQDSVDGAFGRPHIANYLVKKGIVASRQEAFDEYLVKCNVPKLPLSLSEASELVKGADGKLMLAHPNHPRGTSLIKFTKDLTEQQKIIEEEILPYIDGVECWHSEHDKKTIESYLKFTKRLGLMTSGGSDCHQNPILIGKVEIPPVVAEQFGIDL